MSDRGNERRHDHPIHPMGLHNIIAGIAVNRMTGFDEQPANNIQGSQIAAPQPAPVVKMPRKER